MGGIIDCESDLEGMADAVEEQIERAPCATPITRIMEQLNAPSWPGTQAPVQPVDDQPQTMDTTRDYNPPILELISDDEEL